VEPGLQVELNMSEEEDDELRAKWALTEQGEDVV
jgi:hypothetical protein